MLPLGGVACWCRVRRMKIGITKSTHLTTGTFKKEKEIPIATKIIGTEGLEPSLRTQAIALPTELRSKGEATSFRLLPGGV